jgi:hypothetical protein
MLIEFLHPRSIQIPSDRQRSKLDTGDLKSSIKRFGILNPIIIRREIQTEDEWIDSESIWLVAGGRRHACALELGLDTVPCRDFSSLSAFELRCIELEENIKRKDLPWRDAVKAIGDIHKDQVGASTSWSQKDTAEALSFDESTISRILTVYAKLTDPRLANCTSYVEAYNVLIRQAERRTAGIINEIVMEEGVEFYYDTAQILQGPSQSPNPPPQPLPDIDAEIPKTQITTPMPDGVVEVAVRPAYNPVHISLPILNQDFLAWDFQTPSKFNLLHVDFPYGVNAADAMSEGYENTKEIYWALTHHLVENQDKFVSYSAHCIFWLNMRYFVATSKLFSLHGWKVLPRPLIWHKSDMRGSTTTDGKQPRHTYEAALFMFRGERPLVKQIGDSYAAPTPDKPIHPTQKPVPVLNYFLSGLVDSTTDMFDPTAGSGSSLVAAEELGARSVAGLELSPEFCTAANDEIRKRRNIRLLRGA